MYEVCMFATYDSELTAMRSIARSCQAPFETQRANLEICNLRSTHPYARFFSPYARADLLILATRSAVYRSANEYPFIHLQKLTTSSLLVIPIFWNVYVPNLSERASTFYASFPVANRENSCASHSTIRIFVTQCVRLLMQEAISKIW